MYQFFICVPLKLHASLNPYLQPAENRQQSAFVFLKIAHEVNHFMNDSRYSDYVPDYAKPAERISFEEKSFKSDEKLV